jgi:hypothetical protein
VRSRDAKEIYFPNRFSVRFTRLPSFEIARSQNLMDCPKCPTGDLTHIDTAPEAQSFQAGQASQRG